MCGSFALMVKPNELQAAFDLDFVPPALSPKDHYYPGQGIPAVLNAAERVVEILYWGLIPPWAKDISISRHTFNARCETLRTKASFKMAYQRRRCLIPATAYYEWRTANDRKIPYKFSLKGTKVFMLAGLWEYWVDATGNEVYSATVVTCPAGNGLEAYHDRMPVVLDRYNCWQWMEDRPLDELDQLLSPVDAEYFDIECLDPQRTLF
ncbi:MAG: SOS response-associated peptidase [Anaerolineaceae bacterium]|nr:SOS response-associated peptidase [Anaerolineaceae bacterium]